ncbi:hypothetical protein PMI08_01498, partial [Brevibacillus sp. CF112]
NYAKCSNSNLYHFKLKRANIFYINGDVFDKFIILMFFFLT